MRFSSGSPKFSVALTACIVGIWVILLGFLLLKEYSTGVNHGTGDSFRIAAVESDDWFLLRMSGSYAGFGRSRQFRQEDKWIIRDELNLSLNLHGHVKPVKILSESTVDEDFRLVSFYLKVISGIVSFDYKGRMDGRDLVLEIPSFQGGGIKKLRLSEAPRISRSLGLPIPITGIQVGDEIRVPVFDPLDGGKSEAFIRVIEQAEVEIGGRKMQAWRVRASYRAFDLTMWIDDQGRLLKGQMPLNITVTRSNKNEISKEMRTSRELPDLVSMTSVPVEGNLPDQENLGLLRIAINSHQLPNIPSDYFRQEVKQSEIIITKEKEPEATYALPWTDPKMEQYLKSSRFIRSDHPDIIKKAREIVGSEKNPVKAAKLINQWVSDHLKKVPTPSVPDAYTVLMTKQGDCNEHAILAVALARAIGIPAQVAVGLIYTDEGFFYHAWVVYWAGKTWFTGDPLTNRIPVPPGYVTLLYGDVDKHTDVVSFLGQLKFKIIEAK